MQTASGTLAAAITAQERSPKLQLLVDWDNDGTFSQAIDDQSARVESIQIDRTLTTDLPDAVDLLAGYSTATASITLSDNPADETDDAPGYYSPYSTGSPIYGKRRRWRTVLLALGFAGTAGTELLTAFTGKTRSLSSTGTSQTADLELFDNTELMRGSVDVPLVVADNPTGDRPGLNGAWIVDYLARKCGFNASPPPRTGCVFLATFAGSAHPEIAGSPNNGLILGASAGDVVSFTAGKFIAAASSPDPSSRTLIMDYELASPLSTNNGGEVLVDGWTQVNGGAGRFGILEVTSAFDTSPATKVSLTVNSSNQLIVNIRRTATGAITAYNSGLTVPAGVLAYVGVHVYFTSTTITIHWRVNGTSNSNSFSTTSVTGQPALTFVSFDSAEDATTAYQFGAALGYEAWQVSNPGSTTGAPTWNDAYVGNSVIQPSLNTLTATVPTSDAATTVIQQIAAAEMATAGFDETGRFTYYTRNRWTSAPYTTSQRTVDASSLKDLTVTEAVDQVRNRVRATASPAAIQSAGFVWRTADIITIAAGGSATVTASFDNPATSVDDSISYAAANNPTASYYRANRNRDGSGTAVSNLTFTVALTATTATIVIGNPNGFVVYLVTPPGFTDPQGAPALGLWGQAVLYAQSPTPDTTTPGVTVPTQTVYDVVDAASKSEHGEQLLEIPVNPWLQDGSSLATLVADLLARLKDPPPVLTGLSIPYDPRLQLGDRVTVVADQFGMSQDFFLIGSHVSQTVPGGATQTLDTRAV